jgi:DNA-binding MarR family transcriptional regulator
MPSSKAPQAASTALRRPRTTRPRAGHAQADDTGCAERLDTSYLETLLGYNARRAALAVIAVFLRRMEPFGLRPVDFSVLTLIAHNPGATSSQICTALDILPPNLVGMLKTLEKRGLVVRRPHPNDGRAQGLHLTPEGAQLQAQAQAEASRLEREDVGLNMSDDELSKLIALLQQVYRR